MYPILLVETRREMGCVGSNCQLKTQTFNASRILISLEKMGRISTGSFHKNLQNVLKSVGEKNYWIADIR